jgi:hypothetical protein
MLGRDVVVALAFGTVLAVLATCGFDTRSDDLVCEVQADCLDGRICEDGLCVLTTRIDAGPMADADPNAPDADPNAPDAMPTLDATPVVCPSECDRCEGNTCVIECVQADSCSNQIVCPSGLDCQVVCSGSASCNNGIDCSMADSCDLTCSTIGSCGGQLLCGTGPCNAVCSGTGTCDNGIDCSNSCACDTDCSGNGACDNAPSCPGPGTCTAGDDDCRSGPPPCNNCT